MSYKRTVVAFLDVLGTKQNKEYASKLRIHRAFHESMRDFQSRDKPNSGYDRKMYAFSDCAYVLHMLHDQSDESIYSEDLLIQAALFNVALTTLRVLSEGYLVRGGISYGDVHTDELGCFGPALEEAYHLENKVAVMPRILICGELGRRAKLFSDNAHMTVFSDLNPNYRFMPQRKFLPELVRQVDGEFYLNSLYPLEMEPGIRMGDMDFSLAQVKEAIHGTLSRSADAGRADVRVRQKLDWMSAYIDAARFSLDESAGGIALVE